MDINLLYRFFNGETSPEEEAGIKEWFDASEENRKIFFRERKIFDAAILNAGSVSGDLIHARTHRRLSGILKIAAAVAIAVVSSWAVSDMLFTSRSRSAMQTISVPSGQRLNIVLPDGSDVWLNSGTSFSYPSAFSRKNRIVELDGEAYFDVARDELCPFIVHTSKYDVKVLGTVFNVEAYSNKKNFSASLVEGAVQISRAGKASTEPAVVLKASEQAYIGSDGKLEVRPFTEDNTVSWKDGLLIFRNKTLGEILDDFRNFYGVDINLADPDRYKKLYTGKFRQRDGIGYAMEILQHSMGFTYEIDPESGTIIIH